MSNDILRKIISFLLSFIMMICIIVAVFSTWLMFEVLNYDALRVKAGDKFYSLLYDEVCENVLLRTVSTGVPEEIVLEPITRETIDYWTCYQLEAIIAGEKFKIDLSEMKEGYVEAFQEYARETGASLDNAGAKKLAEYCISTVKTSIELPLGSLLASYIGILRKYLPPVIIVCFAFAVLLGVFILRISKPRINVTRYYGLSLCGVGIIGLIASISALATKIYTKINLDSDAYNSALSGLGSYLLKSLLMLSAVIFLIGAIALVVYSVYGVGNEKEDVLYTPSAE